MTMREILDEVIRREGGFVHDRLDPGGPTKFGITQFTLSNWRGHDVSADEVAALTYDEAVRIYEKKYVEEPGFLQLPCPLRPAAVDFAVNSGPVTAIKQLQRSLGVTADGILGPATLAAVRMSDLTRVQTEYAKFRVRYLASLVVAQPVKTRFLLGWLNRAMEFLPAGTQS
jgi:lysozyme family protein